MSVKVVTAPEEFPVTLTEAKAHLRIDHTYEDTLITALIEAATIYAEKFTGRALIDQTLDVYLDEFPVGALEIPKPPLISVTGLFYTNSGGSEIEFTDFDVDDASEPARLYLPMSGTWPTPSTAPNSVRIRVRAGYIDATVSPAEANVPPSIKAAILLYIGALYENREAVGANNQAVLPWGAEQLLRQFRVEKAMA